MLDGWNYDTSYEFHITHLPDTGLITLKLFSGASLIHNVTVQVIIITITMTIIVTLIVTRQDSGADRLRGGRLGVYCDSQEMISWSALSYRSSLLKIQTNVNCLYLRCLQIESGEFQCRISFLSRKLSVSYTG